MSVKPISDLPLYDLNVTEVLKLRPYSISKVRPSTMNLQCDLLTVKFGETYTRSCQNHLSMTIISEVFCIFLDSTQLYSCLLIMFYKGFSAITKIVNLQANCTTNHNDLFLSLYDIIFKFLLQEQVFRSFLKKMQAGS